jgi:hypothetical protein
MSGECIAQASSPLPHGNPASGRETISLSVSSISPEEGEPVLVEVAVSPPVDNLTIAWKGRTYPMKKTGDGRFLALVGVDLMDPPGAVPLAIGMEGTGPGMRLTLDLPVREKQFPVQEISLPAEMAVFDNATLARIRAEAGILEQRLSAVSAPSWDLPFLPPVEEYRPTGFGARRVINGEPRSPHTGADIRLPAGTPVRSIAAGVTAFSGEQFFGGRSVVLDHGGGLFSIYYHLQETAVKEGQRVERGETIGAVGSSGRATGPHLHFGVRAAGGRIDPSLLFGPAFR